MVSHSCHIGQTFTNEVARNILLTALNVDSMTGRSCDEAQLLRLPRSVASSRKLSSESDGILAPVSYADFQRSDKYNCYSAAVNRSKVNSPGSQKVPELWVGRSSKINSSSSPPTREFACAMRCWGHLESTYLFT